jgi:DNA-binding SARP family transcriptional activator/tetratricopeptide (TPR) repeat protein
VTNLRLALLGRPVVERDEAPVSFDTRKALALLALLAVSGREQSRQRLAAMLWPDSDDFKARAALRRTISVAAGAIGASLVVSRQAVRLDPAAVQVDIIDFERLLSAGDTDSLERAVRLYRDDFLAGFGLRDSPEFDDWQEQTSERFRQRLGAALEQLVRTWVADGDLSRALDHARRWLSLDPLHEPAHQALIRLYAWTGQRSSAVKQYRACVGVLDRELGVAPLPPTTELYEEVLAGALTPAVPADPTRPPDAFSSESAPAAGAAAGPPFVDRVAELAALVNCWQSVGPQGRLVALVGEPGSGKSSLLTRFRHAVEGGGVPVLAARGHEGEAGLPYIAVADLLRAAAAIWPDLADRLPRQMAMEVGRLAPELAPSGRASPPALDSPAGLARLYSAIAATLRAVFADAPGVVALEDLQWADERSLDVLAYLMRRLPELPLLLVVSWSPENAERLRVVLTALAEATDSGLGQVITLEPFGPDEIRDLLEAIGAPVTDLERLLDETRGLPLLVRAYGDALVQGGAEAGPPASARELLSRRLTAVGQPTAQLISAAAVLGRGFDADLLRAVSGRGEGEVVDGLEAALAHALLVEAPSREAAGAPSYDFPYEALRRVAYDATSLARRRLVHGRAADVLVRRHERDPSSIRAATVAHHLQQAGRESEATQWWWAAAERSRSVYAHAEALACINQALALGYPEGPALVASGDVLTALGRYGEALQAFEAAAARLDADDLGLAEVEHKLAELHHRLGEWALSASHLHTARDLLPDGQLSRRARLEADLALVAYRRGDFGDAAVLGKEALTLSRQADDPSALAQATNVLGVLAARSGEPAAAELLLRESLEHARRIADPGAAVAAGNNLSRLLGEAGRLDEALAEAAQALQLGSEHGDQHRVAALHTNLADLLHASGQHDAALEHVKQSARLFAAVDAGGPIRPEIWALVEW